MLKNQRYTKNTQFFSLETHEPYEWITHEIFLLLLAYFNYVKPSVKVLYVHSYKWWSSLAKAYFDVIYELVLLLKNACGIKCANELN